MPGTDIETSVLGMGTASLGSRIPAASGRRRLEDAYERGITWYDTAPVYGAGEAEAILAPFLAAHRDSVFVCSKVGLAPPRHNSAMRLAYALGRPVIGAASGLRRRFRALKATRNVRLPLTAERIETSIVLSLARLCVDHLDVYALHDPDPVDLGRDEILRALEKVRTRGLTRHIAVAGTFEAARRAAALPLFSLFQLADDPAERTLARLRPFLDRPAAFVTHSVLGVDGARARLTARMESDPALRARLALHGYDGPPERVATDLLMRRAFAANPDGVVLASMFSRTHLADNAGRAALSPDSEAARLVEAVFAPAPLSRAEPALPARAPEAFS